MERWAVSSGPANVAATWNGGTLPLATDDVYANSFIVTITADVTWLSCRTTAGVTAVAGGGFTLNNGVTLTANCYAGDVNCVTYTGTAGNSATINGDCVGGSVVNANGVQNSIDGTLTVNGFAIGSATGVGAGVNGAGAIPIRIRGAKHGANGSAPTIGLVTFLDPVTASFEVRNAALATKTLTVVGPATERWAVATGNASNPATWNGGTLPDANDDCYSNGFTVSIDVDTQYGSVRTTAGTTAVVGGGFKINSSRTLRANAFAGTTPCVFFAGIAGFSANFIGNATGGSATNARGIENQSTGTLNITGNLMGGTSSNGSAHGGANTGAGTMIVTGNCTGGAVLNGGGGVSNASGTLIITGTVTAGAGNACNGATNTTSGSMTINGNVFGSGTSGHGAGNAQVGTLTINGNVTGGSNATGMGVTNATGVVNINGNVTGGSVGIGANLTSTGTITINGDVTAGAGATAYGAQVGGSVVGQLTVNGTVTGSAAALGAPGVNSVGTTPVIISKAKYGPLGASPCKGIVLMKSIPAATIEVRNAAFATQLLKFPFAGGGGTGFPLSRVVHGW